MVTKTSPTRACRPPRRRAPAPASAQRGVVMAIALISLVLLMLGVVAMIRTMDSGALLAGNLAFRRDLTNRAEAAMVTARTALASGALASEAARTADLATANYSSSRLATTNGIPNVLLSDSAYTAAGYSGSGSSAAADAGITLRWVIDRQCLAAGAFSTASCESVSGSGDAGGSSWLRKPGGASRPVYRISVRVSGPRGTEAYFQTTYVI